MKFFKAIMVAIMLLTAFNYESLAEEGTKLLQRNEIDSKYKWNLKDLFQSDEEWEKEFSSIKTLLPRIKEFEGKLSSTSKVLHEFLIINEEIGTRYEKLRMYASLAHDLDQKDSKYTAMNSRASALGSDLSTASSFVSPEIIEIPDEKLEKFLSSSEEMKIYRHFFNNLRRFKPHTLPKEQEMLLSMTTPMEETFFNNYQMLVNTDFIFPTIKDDKGNDIQMSQGRFYAAMISKDRNYRERAYKAIYVPFMSHMNLLTSNFNGSVKANIFNSKARNYNSSIEFALDRNNIPVEVYKNLVSTVNDNLAPLHRFTELKRKLLGVDKLHAYDTYVSLFSEVPKRYTPDQAMEICLEALKPLGTEYNQALKFAFDNRWVDFFETPNKRNGAYSTGAAKGAHPYVLMNWNYTLNDVFTLAHEMGHNMHSWFTAQNQPYPYADYPIFLAEVASTTNEALLLNYLLEKSNSNEEKLYLLETAINNIQTTFFRQTRFAEFEMKVQKLIEDGEALTPDKYAKIFGDDFIKYWGPAMALDLEEANSWCRIHHFYYNFYVFQYATSMSAAEELAKQMIEEGQPAIDKYLSFLKSGRSDYAIPTLKKAGVDMSTPKPIKAIINKADKILDQMELLTK